MTSSRISGLLYRRYFLATTKCIPIGIEHGLPTQELMLSKETIYLDGNGDSLLPICQHLTPTSVLQMEMQGSFVTPTKKNSKDQALERAVRGFIVGLFGGYELAIAVACNHAAAVVPVGWPL